MLPSVKLFDVENESAKLSTPHLDGLGKFVRPLRAGKRHERACVDGEELRAQPDDVSLHDQNVGCEAQVLAQRTNALP